MIATFSIQNLTGFIIPETTNVDANSIPFDHAALVDGLMSRADGYDLQLLDDNGDEVTMTSFENANTATARICFNLVNGLGAGATVNYTLRHGNLGAQVNPFGGVVAGSANVACVVTFADPVLAVPSFGGEETMARLVDESPYPDSLSVRANYRLNTPRTHRTLRWEAITPYEWYEMRAFVHAQRGGSSSFTEAAASFLPNGAYAMVPGSASFTQSSRLGFAAEMAVEDLLP